MTDPKHQSILHVERPAHPERMHPLVSAAMAGGTLDPATLRELMTLQRDWEAGEARKAYTRALVALKRELPVIVGRDQTVDYQGGKGRVRYTHTSLAAAMSAVIDPLTQHGFSIGWTPRTENNQVFVTCRLTHAEGHSEETTLNAPVDQSGAKSPAQGVASTITLLERYTALALLGIATADMQEPKRENEAEDASRIDTSRNLRAMGRLSQLGRTKEEAEKFVGRPVHEWTVADLGRLKQWAQPANETQQGGA